MSSGLGGRRGGLDLPTSGGRAGWAGRTAVGGRARPVGGWVRRVGRLRRACRADRSPEGKAEDATCGSTSADGGQAGPAGGAGSSGGLCGAGVGCDGLGDRKGGLDLPPSGGREGGVINASNWLRWVRGCPHSKQFVINYNWFVTNTASHADSMWGLRQPHPPAERWAT